MTKPPHDRLVKAVFSEARQAVLLLDTFLPAGIRSRMDASTLRLVPGNFVDETLKETLSDLLFTVELMGEGTLLYLLFEHQSTPKRDMPLRQLRLRFGEVDAAALARIRGADLPALKAWLDRVLAGQTFGEVLA